MMYDSYLIYINSNLLRRQICSEHVQRKQSHGKLGNLFSRNSGLLRKEASVMQEKKEPSFVSE